MIVPEQVKLPLLSTAAAHGADETVPPPMMLVPGSSTAAEAAEGAARAPVRTVASEATTMRMRTPDSFRGVVDTAGPAPYRRLSKYRTRCGGKTVTAHFAPITV